MYPYFPLVGSSLPEGAWEYSHVIDARNRFPFPVNGQAKARQTVKTEAFAVFAGYFVKRGSLAHPSV